ncbi:MAG: nitroreductase family protein [Deltaproteobacteria bacterium]|nr:nitroreductase family protein [Deltaproteobacteria bacterium]
MAPNLALADDIELPAPQTEGGAGLFDTLKKRSSVPHGGVSFAELSLQDLSTILWAASGLNRGQTGWTVPMADGLEPYVRIYVAGTDGTYRYSWLDNKLTEISKENVKGKLGSHGFVPKAPYVLIFTTDKEILAKLTRGGQKFQDEFANVLVGAMTQDVYLAAAALNLGTRYIHTMNKDAVVTALGLGPDDYPIALMPIGK